MTREVADQRAAAAQTNAPATVECSIQSDNSIEDLGLKLALEMRWRWQHGEPTRAEEFLSDRPELWQQPEAAADLIYEEFCQREAAGQAGAAADILRRFPQWAGPLRVMLDCHYVLQQRDVLPADSDFPTAGDTVGDFKLLEPLGSGLRGRVFLATQSGLADRPVVLKITPLDGREHLLLASLQHTNIVPLHTVFDDPARGLRILCMPYFGRLTLAALLPALSAMPLAARTGKHILTAIDRLQPSPSGNFGAARQMLAHVSYVQALCWIAASLADALHFAHERGLAHFDLKPANVLLSTDGQPMLLDFHLARAPVLPDGSPVEPLGGTLRYMPPEQQAAMRSFHTGRPIETPVDCRADIFALGALLYESLGGTLPVAADSPPLALVNPQASVGLSDIVAKCLADRPETRYATAASVADDLRRHLTDQPLVGVANRSLRERWHKWRRRRPTTMRTAFLLALATLLLAAAWWQVGDRRKQANAALRDGRTQIENGGQYADAAHSFERGLELVESVPFQGDLPERLREQLGIAKRLLLAQQLHDLADEIRGHYADNRLAADRMRSLASSCRSFWEKRTQMMEALNSTPDREVVDDLQDIALFLADIEVRLTADSDAAAGRHAALRHVDEAESLFGPSALLAHERRVHRQALGLSGWNETDKGAPLPQTAREHYALGRSHLAVEELPQAVEQLAAAVQLDPAGRWPNFYYGLCAYRLGRYEEAVTAFSVCIGTTPKWAGCFHNRGLAYAALGLLVPARHDFERALQLDHLVAHSR